MNTLKKIMLGLLILVVPGGSVLGAYLVKKRYDEHKQQGQPKPEDQA
ncbi:MAG: hypothetical protein KBC57_03055 [Neisseriaceae bacterium]|nr:hypothetical protein [Neisseriaceae bacterium]MBP6861317.1 hypothetical protein [Neisseriaceae bacterium]